MIYTIDIINGKTGTGYCGYASREPLAFALTNALSLLKCQCLPDDPDEWPQMKITVTAEEIETCRHCGCTEQDCSQCAEAQGHPCHWIAPRKCSRCFDENGERKS